MYDPFHPTTGDKEVTMKGESEEGEKYDPFDPTGSPLSNPDDGSGKLRIVSRADSMEDEKQNDKECPDSTDTAVDRQSPFLVSLKKKGEERELTDSDHSDIEEGEIVGAVDRGQGRKRAAGPLIHLNSPNVSFFGPKPERILRVLDGDGFVSVCAEGSWEVDPEEEPVVEVEDLRRKLVSRRKERYSMSFPASSPLSSLHPPSPSNPPPSTSSTSPLTLPVEQDGKNHKTSVNSKDKERQKSKDRKAGKKEERRRKKRKERVGGQEGSKEKERGHKTGKEVKGSRSSSHKRKKRQHSSPVTSPSCNLDRRPHLRQSFSSYERHRDRKGVKERDPERDVDQKKEGRSIDRKKERAPNPASSHRREEEESRKERERKERHSSGSREISKRSNRCREKREGERERQRERNWGRDGRPVVPPSIQDLNGSDLFAIKRTITVTTTTTTTTVPGSPRLPPTSPCWSKQEAEPPRNRKKKRKWHSTCEEKERGCSRSRSRSFSPPKYHSFESDRYSEKMEIDVLSLDGEAMDSDYPSLEDTPPGPLLPEPPVLSPKPKTTSKAGRHHPRKKSHTFKKVGQSESSSSSSRTKNKCLSSLTVTSGAASSGPLSAKQSKKVVKDKDQEKSRRKDGSSAKSSKETGRSRKGKLQSKVSVLVREGVSSTTDTSVGSAKLGMDLLGTGSAGGGGGSAVVGGSIAVVFCRDNESRSPFLKPCSELSSLGGRAKDLSAKVKKSSLASTASSFTGPVGLKSKKAKASSITSTSSSSTSSPSSSLITKHCRRVAKKTRDKGGPSGLSGNCSQSNATSEGWADVSLDALLAVEDGSKSASPHTDQICPPPCSSSSSSSSSSTSVLPPSSSPPHTPPVSIPPVQDIGDSSPDSQTVDSSCKTPDPPFQGEDSPNQSSPVLPQSSPLGLSTPQGAAGLGNSSSAPAAKPLPLEEAPKTLLSPSCSSSSANCGLASLSMPLSSTEPSSSSVSSSSAGKPAPPHPPPAPALPWSLQTGVDCATGGVLALTALLFKMEEANFASRAKAQEFIQATSQILSQANQSQSQQLAPPPSAVASSQIPPPPSLPPHPELSPSQFILHSSLPLVSCSKTPPTHLHSSIGGGCFQAPPTILPGGQSGLSGTSGDTAWDSASKDPDKYLKKLHTQERAVEEVKLAIKPYYQRKDINKEEYKDILRKAVHKICHSRTGEINPVKVSNLVKLYVQRYKYFRKHGRKMEEEERGEREAGPLHSLD